AIPAMLDLFSRFSVRSTWATVGFLFARDRDELMAHVPRELPEYVDANLSPYPHLTSIGRDERDDPYHFAPSMLRRIADTEGQEIASHTFSHYYCLEPGQNAEAFSADLDAARAIGAARGLVPKTLVLPRNQWNRAYHPALARSGFVGYRVNRAHPILRSRRLSQETLPQRALRFADSYVPISGQLSVPETPPRDGVVELTASAFLRPYSRRLRHLDALKLRRIERPMRAAAERGEVFHLWWHPHNFGRDLDANLSFLTKVLEAYRRLSDERGMVSRTMGELCAHTVSESQ
ncbi:MAG: polysaccharide deacetylase, partial [Sandaracinaceae bacterium]